MNSGYANLLSVQAEDGFLGSVTGTAYALPGKMAFTYEPVLEGGIPSVNVWRQQDGDSYAARYFTGSLDIEYAHTEAMALLLSSLLRRSGTTPNYTFDSHYKSARQSLTLGLSYQPNALHLLLKGVIVETMTLSVRTSEIIRCRFDLKFANLTDTGPLSSIQASVHTPIGHLSGEGEYNGDTLTRATEMSCQMQNRIELTNFDEAGLATGYQPSGEFTVNGDFAEWLGDTEPNAHRVAHAVRNQTESSYKLSLAPSSGKLFEIEVPRLLVRAGTPPGFAYGGLAYRASTEAQQAEDRADSVTIVMTL